MREVRLNQRPIGDVAAARVELSDHPERFRSCMARTLVAVERGEDPATAAWTAVDAVKTAAEIEALAGLRRLAYFRKDSK